MIKKSLLLAVLMFSATSCASIISGRKQEITVSASQPGVQVSDGRQTWTAPAVLTLPRKQATILTFSKEGYRTQSVPLNQAVNGWAVGNIFLGGPIGLGIDALSGALWKFVPEAVSVDLYKAENNN